MAEAKKKKIRWSAAWADARELVWAHRSRLALGAVLMLVNQAMGLVLPASTKYLIDAVIVKGRIDLLWKIALAAAIATIVQALTSFSLSQVLGVAAQRAITEMRKRVQAQIARLPISYFDSTQTGKLISRIMNDAEGIRNLVGTGLVQLVGSFITAVVAICVLFWLNWRLTSITILVLGIFGGALAFAFTRLRPLFRERGEITATLTGRLAESLGGIRIVKAFVMETFEIGKFKAATQRLLKTNLRIVRADALTGPVMELLGAATIVGLLLYARNQILHHVQTTGSFVAFLYALIKMYEPIKRLTGINNQFQQAVGASEQVFRYLDVSSEVADRPDAIELRPFEKEIVFEHVDFSYEAGVPLLRDVNLRIARGEVVALVGSSGAGKSTLANLIPRFFDVTGGRVLIDGHNVRDVTLKSLRAQIGMVTQETILFNDTVSNNICYGRTIRDTAAMEEAARTALAHEFITEMPEGYETAIGERGQRLSGGQRQRIAIARALLKNPPLLILDEATSELDTESELLVQRALANLMVGRTVLVIAHRLSTVRRADRIVVLDRGTISEIGTHQDLVTRGGIYQRLHELQFVDAEP